MSRSGVLGAGEAPVVSGRPQSPLFGVAVLGLVLMTVGVTAATLAGAVWPLLAAAAIAIVLTAPLASLSWRYRGDHAALRKARRRVVASCEHQTVGELRGMVSASPELLRDVVHAHCHAADAEGRALIVEMDDGDRMEQAWRDEGFDEVEHVQTSWGRVTLLLRPPR